MDRLTLEQMQFCIDECDKEEVPARYVRGMFDAYVDIWYTYLTKGDFLTHNYLQRLCSKVLMCAEPVGYRDVVVEGHPHPEGIPLLMERLLSKAWDIDPQTLFIEFMTIRPFEEGTCRMAAFMFNLTNGTLGNPMPPPRFRK